MNGWTNEIHDQAVVAVERGRSTMIISPSPASVDRYAEILVEPECAADVLAALSPEASDYEHNPGNFQVQASAAFAGAAPEIVEFVQCAMALDCALIKITGFRVPDLVPPTPLDGKVSEADTGYYVRLLVGALTCNAGLSGYAYASENGGRLLRAVVPVATAAFEASSQGFAQELVWHNDNNNRPIAGVEHRAIGGQRMAPMNPFQAFVAVTPQRNVPMELMSLADVLRQARREHGSNLIEQLERSEFTVHRPASHGGGMGQRHVPVLLRDASGRLCGRLHLQNVRGETPGAIEALSRLQATIATSVAKIEVECDHGTLLIYSNTRMLHCRRRYAPALDRADRYFIRLYLMPEELHAEYGGRWVFD